MFLIGGYLRRKIQNRAPTNKGRRDSLRHQQGKFGVESWTFLEQGKNLAREWKSVYACCSTHGSHVFLCFYTEAPRILGVLSADVSRDGDANLSCIVSCYPPSNITWKFNGKNLTRSARYEFIDSIYMLKVKNVQFVDAGLYECSLINELGEARANASLTVGCECWNYCSQGNCRFFPFS